MANFVYAATRERLLTVSGFILWLSGCGQILGIESFSAGTDASTSSDPSSADDPPPPPPDPPPTADASVGLGEEDDGSDDGASGQKPDPGIRPDGSAGPRDAAPPGPDAGADIREDACAADETRCLDDAVSTCGADGQWSAPRECAVGETCREGACTSARSCAMEGAGTSRCGPNGESCCTSLTVPSGMFHRTYNTAVSGSASRLGAPASVSEYRLDKYLVTVGRFRAFVEAWRGGYLPPEGSGKHDHLNAGLGLARRGGGHEPGWLPAHSSSVAPTDENLSCDSRVDVWTAEPGEQEDRPVRCVTWPEAYAFCIWDGGFLPSDAEWTYAAAGGDEQRRYPWGAEAPGTDSEYAIYGCLHPMGPVVLGVGVCNGANLPSVGTAARGAARWGHLDMTGALWAWTLDSGPSSGTQAGYAELCSDCLRAEPEEDRVARGGHFEDAENKLFPTSRDAVPRTTRSRGLGFRCARAP